ncbi:paf acetylhydrolase family protein [Colletotrichum karsti]|uniref:1-alkyl-2-acetylglycerophosphocholine esterase n=1 Tax=Colletotrichum karsti TaxID=1095194 RepID=A0A9P6IDZ4_9PEZI|nr:paf acetylhydrolase family protein [Colletotrichum karsti]KAF9881652.1 paf acetylhydrolase family protein [Colletotrichum karsti]
MPKLFNMRVSYSAVFASLAAAVIIPSPLGGPHSVAYKVKTFEDSARWDPYAPEDKPEKRRVLVSAYVPLDQKNCTNDVVPYMPPTTAKVMAQVSGSFGVPVPDDVFDDLELEFCDLGRPCRSKRNSAKEGYPLVLFSPGRGGSRLAYGLLARTLASYGYIVITMDHTYETSIVEFPDGSVVYAVNANNSEVKFVTRLVETRQADVSFLIDQLTTPSVAAQLLDGTKATIDSQKIFVYGHSLGGATAAEAVRVDQRVLGGLNFDGAMYGPITTEGTDRPFVMVGTPISLNRTLDGIAPWNQTWANLRGPALLPIINGTEHNTFLDAPQLPTIKALLPDFGPLVAQLLGTIDGDRAGYLTTEIVRAALQLVFDGNKEGFCNIGKLGPEITYQIKGVDCT